TRRPPPGEPPRPADGRVRRGGAPPRLRGRACSEAGRCGRIRAAVGSDLKGHAFLGSRTMTMDMLEKVVLRWMAFCLLGVVALGGVSACDDAPATGANPPAACEGDACPCASTSECADGEFCDAELKVCLPRVC